jgi:hypothetical protein
VNPEQLVGGGLARERPVGVACRQREGNGLRVENDGIGPACRRRERIEHDGGKRREVVQRELTVGARDQPAEERLREPVRVSTRRPARHPEARPLTDLHQEPGSLVDREDVPARRLGTFVPIQGVLAGLAPPAPGAGVRGGRVSPRQRLDELVRVPSVRVEERALAGDRVALRLAEEAGPLKVGTARVEAVEPEVAFVAEWARRARDWKALTGHLTGIVSPRRVRFYGTEVLRNPHQTRYPGSGAGGSAVGWISLA